MANTQELENTLSYIQSELTRMETIAGTLSSVERDHFNRLTRFEHRELNDIAVEEQNAARQLGTIKQMCLSMIQKIDEISSAKNEVSTEERTDHAGIH